MIRRNTSNEGSARSDGMMIVAVMFIAAFTFIAWTTNPVYTGIGVGDRVEELKGEMTTLMASHGPISTSAITMTKCGLKENRTWTMLEFMDTNCVACENAAPEIN